jgi:hypothetical protein
MRSRDRGEQRLRHRRQRDVGLLVSRHPALAARAVRGLPVLLAPASSRSPPFADEPQPGDSGMGRFRHRALN